VTPPTGHALIASPYAPNEAATARTCEARLDTAASDIRQASFIPAEAWPIRLALALEVSKKRTIDAA